MDHITYPAGQCTRWVADNWSNPVGPYWGNGENWLHSASASGYDIAHTPSVGDIAVWGVNMGGTGSAGHVAIVTNVNPLIVSESNWKGDLRVGSRVVPSWSQAGILGYVIPRSREVSEVNYLLPGPAANSADALARRVRIHEWYHLSGRLYPQTLTGATMDELLNLWIAQGAEAVFARMLGA